MVCFAGIDWGCEKHAVCVVDEAGTVRASFEVRHDAAGLKTLVRRLAECGPLCELRVGIERPSGIVIDTLLEAGVRVVPIHPHALKAYRPRYRQSGAKDDRGDAYIAADVVRTDGHRHPDLHPHGEDIRILRALVRTREDLVRGRVANANRLRSLLESFWPGAAVIFADVDSPIALAFLRKFPTPASAAKLGERGLEKFLAQKRYSGRRTAAQLLQRLHGAAEGKCSEREAAVRGRCVLRLVNVLEETVAALQEVTAELEELVASLLDGQIVMSFPRAGRVNAAQILAELGDDRGRFVSAEHLAAEAGVVPVTYASGKSRGVGYRWGCNKLLRRAVCTFADNSRHVSPWAAVIYKNAISRGKRHPQAIRIVARSWLHVLWRAWQDRKPYDHAKHGAAARMPAIA